MMRIQRGPLEGDLPVVWRTRLKSSHSNPMDVLEEARPWLDRFRLPSLPTPLTEGAWSGENDSSLTVRIFPSSGGQAVQLAALRVRNSVRHQGLTWTTDLGVRALDGGGSHISLVVSQDANPGALARFDTAPLAAPAVLTRLVERVAGTPPPMAAEHWAEGARALDLARLVAAEDRPFPLVVVSDDSWSRRPLLDPAALAKRLSGISQVVRVSKEVSRRLPDAFTGHGVPEELAARWGVFGGAVRVYRPSVRLAGGDPFMHPLYFPRDVQAPRFVESLVEWCAFHSTLRTTPLDVGVADVEAASQAALIRALPDVQTAEALLEEANERDSKNQEHVASLNAQVAGLQDKLDRLEAKSQAQQYDYERRLSAFSPGEVSDGSDFASTGTPALRFYRTAAGRYPALDFVEALPASSQHEVRLRLTGLPELLQRGAGKVVEKVHNAEVWEFKINSVKDHWIRFLFARSAERPEILVLTGFTKKQNKLDPGEIERATDALRLARDGGWE